VIFAACGSSSGVVTVSTSERTRPEPPGPRTAVIEDLRPCRRHIRNRHVGPSAVVIALGLVAGLEPSVWPEQPRRMDPEGLRLFIRTLASPG
jgi:hypothetical protein